jgi:hypothetical protein
MSTRLILPNGSSRRGAQLGRGDVIPDDTPRRVRLRLQKLRWVDGDYDQGGAYWGGGTGKDVWCAWQTTTALRVFVWAESRDKAIQNVRGRLQDRCEAVEFYAPRRRPGKK